MTSTNPSISAIIPARNEASCIGDVVAAVWRHVNPMEVIVVDDGSTDETACIAAASNASVIKHPYPLGNGAAVKTGARAARGEILLFLDADGQHDPAEAPRLVAALGEGYDMAVGARSSDAQASVGRRLANGLYNRIASYMTGQRVLDLTSGFRAVRASRFREFLHLLPNGFSYPTTVTMAFYRAGYPVTFVPVQVRGRAPGSRSHIRPLRDGARFLLIIFRVATLYSPLKIFAPTAALLFLSAWAYYAYTFATMHRFTNMSAALLITSVIIFLMGLISEQITMLLYRGREEARHGPEAAPPTGATAPSRGPRPDGGGPGR